MSFRNGRLAALAIFTLAGALAVSSACAEVPSSVQTAPKAFGTHKICAARDLALVVLLEERGWTTSSHKLDTAFRDVVRARKACEEGDLAEALRIYDGAALGLAAE